MGYTGEKFKGFIQLKARFVHELPCTGFWLTIKPLFHSEETTMARKKTIAALSAISLLALPLTATAAENPFKLETLKSGYEVAADETKDKDGKCGEGKCGGDKTSDKKADGKCGEGKCGGSKTSDKKADGKCGEGKCGSNK